MTEPLMIPYPGDHGSGSAAGSATSKERQVNNDASGITSTVQRRVYDALGDLKSEGITALEVEFALGVGHGMASSALSHLHRAGKVTRIKMRRKRHEIYVLPEYVNGREESPYRPRLEPAKHPRDLSQEQVFGAMMDAGVDESLYPEVRKVLNALP